MTNTTFLSAQSERGAQQKDRQNKNLKEVHVTEYKAVHDIGHLLEMKDGIIYAGKKTEIIVVDSLDANKAINNTRQILGRISGLNNEISN